VAYCLLHKVVLSAELAIRRACLEKQCFHLARYKGGANRYKHKRRNYKNLNPKIKLRDLKNEINSRKEIDFDFWNANLTSRH